MTGTGYRESLFSRLTLFVSSLSPAFAIASIGLWDAQGSIKYWFAVLAFATFTFTPLVILVRKWKAGRQILSASSVRDDSDQIPTYFITFVFPFLFLSPDMSPSTSRAYIAFAILMALMLFRTPLSTVNPALLIVGLNVYSVELETGSSVYVLSRRKSLLTPGKIYAKRIVSDLYITVND